MSINQGASMAAMSVRGEDYYPTPIEALETLLCYYPVPHRVWDPCAGRGELSTHLSHLGYLVTATELTAWPDADPRIIPGVDFLTTPHRPEGLEAIVMNPPFNLIDGFIRKALTIAPTVIVFARLMYIEGAAKSDFMDHNLIQILAGKERLPMLHREGYEGKKIKKSGVPFGWFIFGPPYRIPSGLTSLRRVSWYDEDARRRLAPNDRGRREPSPVPGESGGHPPSGGFLAGGR